MQVAALTAAGGAHVDHEKPYAELWYVINLSVPAESLVKLSAFC